MNPWLQAETQIRRNFGQRLPNLLGIFKNNPMIRQLQIEKITGRKNGHHAGVA
jgi:hypothetical protein